MRTALLILLSAAPALAGEHTVVSGEHLWGLSKRYYGDPYQWRRIAEANPQVKDPHWIYPAQTLVIPDAAAAPALSAPAPAPVEAAQEVSGADKADLAAAEATGLEVAEAPVEPPPPPKAPEPVPEMPPVSADDSDGLSVQMPRSLTGQYPSMSRLSVDKGWKADGRVTGLDDREVIAAQGDAIEAKLADGTAVAAGDLFYVLREDAPEEGESRDMRYLQRVGVIRAEAEAGRGRWRFRILKSGDSLQVDDVLSRKAL